MCHSFSVGSGWMVGADAGSDRWATARWTRLTTASREIGVALGDADPLGVALGAGSLVSPVMHAGPPPVEVRHPE